MRTDQIIVYHYNKENFKFRYLFKHDLNLGNNLLCIENFRERGICVGSSLSHFTFLTLKKNLKKTKEDSFRTLFKLGELRLSAKYAF
jgi:hypothetical protein